MLSTRRTKTYHYYALEFNYTHGRNNIEIRRKEDECEERTAVEVSLMKNCPIHEQLYPTGFSHK